MIDKLKLLSGTPIDVGIGKIHPLTIKDIAEIGEEQYNKYLQCLLVDKSNVDLSKNIDDVKNFDILIALCIQDNNFLKQTMKALDMFFKEKVNIHQNGYFYLKDIKNNRFITRDNYDEIVKVIKSINCIAIKEEKEYNPANEKAKKLIEQFKKNKEQTPKKKNKDNELYNIVSAVSWKSELGIQNIFNLTIYQLYDAVNRLNLIDNYNYTMISVYTGSMEVKKNELKKLTWLKSIDE